jgi:hypothetical protein
MTTNIKPKRNYRGRNANRLKYPDARKEVVFSKAWKDWNIDHPNTIKDILGEEPTDEQVELLSTLVQWLGSSKGFVFCDQTVRKCLGILK